MFRVFSQIGPNLDQIWAWLPRGHNLAVDVRDPLKRWFTVLSRNQVSQIQKIPIAPLPRLPPLIHYSVILEI